MSYNFKKIIHLEGFALNGLRGVCQTPKLALSCVNDFEEDIKLYMENKNTKNERVCFFYFA
jgi:hypothetical protein